MRASRQSADWYPQVTQRAVYAIEYLSELHKNYYEFFKANIENLSFFDVEAMKKENMQAGIELEKTVNHIRDILNKPFGKQVDVVEFDPLNIQKDIPDKKKPDALNFLNKNKTTQAKPEDLLSNDLLGLDIQSAGNGSTATQQHVQTTSTQKPAPQSTGKPNALNFLKKNEAPKSQPQAQPDLLDIDLLGGSIPASIPSTTSTKVQQSSASVGLDLFDLSAGTANTYPEQSKPRSEPNQPPKPAPFSDDIFDLTGTGLSQPAKQKPGKPANEFDLRLM